MTAVDTIITFILVMRTLHKHTPLFSYHGLASACKLIRSHIAPANHAAATGGPGGLQIQGETVCTDIFLYRIHRKEFCRRLCDKAVTPLRGEGGGKGGVDNACGAPVTQISYSINIGLHMRHCSIRYACVAQAADCMAAPAPGGCLCDIRLRTRGDQSRTGVSTQFFHTAEPLCHGIFLPAA